MKLVILSSSPFGAVARRLLDAARRVAIQEVKVVGLVDVDLLLQEDLSNTVILPRIAPEQNEATDVLDDLSQKGAYIINPRQSWIDSRDKWRTFEVLQDAHVATPESLFVQGGVFKANTVLGDKVIFKPLNGTHGNGIIMVRDGDALPNEPGILQRFIPEADNADIRVFVIGDTVVAAIRRVAKTGDFRANLHQGAVAEEYVPSEEMQRLAINAAKALGLEVAGVDILPTATGGLVIEANPSPGLGIEKYTSVDVAGALMDYIATIEP